MRAMLWIGMMGMAGVVGCTQGRGDLGTPMDKLATSAKQPNCTQYDVLLAARQALAEDEGIEIGRVLYQPGGATRGQAKGPSGPYWKVEVLAEQAGPKYVLVDDMTGDVLP